MHMIGVMVIGQELLIGIMSIVISILIVLMAVYKNVKNGKK